MRLTTLLLSAALMATCPSARAAALTMAPGVFDLGKSEKALGQFEYRFPVDWSGFRPQAGLFVSEDSVAYVYTGLGYPFSLSEKWSIVPSVSAGYYNDGTGKDLGNSLEFYSQLRLEYQPASNGRIGLGYGHISNAGLGDDNPGAETLYLSYSLRF
ncbi:MAG TPA: acyloxyacyl hydrolase [Gammaproteobacteria bacterium]|nr:acyloxyacyl hydrolase [Gammaproteobacteria bacterium]